MENVKSKNPKLPIKQTANKISSESDYYKYICEKKPTKPKLPTRSRTHTTNRTHTQQAKVRDNVANVCESTLRTHANVHTQDRSSSSTLPHFSHAKISHTQRQKERTLISCTAKEQDTHK